MPNITYDWPTNFSNGTDRIGIESLGNVIQYVNYVTDNWLAYGVLLTIFMISFGISIFSGSRKALLASSFITLIFSVYFLRLGMVNPIITFILVVGMIIGAIGSKEEGRI